LGKDNSKRVIFNIHIISHSVDIKDFSQFSQEREVLLLPGRYLEKLSVHQ